jgi:hypothetical protein
VRGYSAVEIFSREEVELFEKATEMVSYLAESKTLRCHELARAVGTVLGLQHQDGYYGFVNHTWLWTTKLEWSELTTYTRLGFPNILDVYSVGQLPMVRLVDGKHTSLPHVGWAYRPDYRGGPSKLDNDRVRGLVEELRHRYEQASP